MRKPDHLGELCAIQEYYKRNRIWPLHASALNSESTGMELSSDTKMKEIEGLAQEFFDNVIRDEEPIFVSDEATIWDVSMAPPEELRRSCSDYYRVAVSMDDLKLPLWELIPLLDQRRRQIADNGAGAPA